MMNFFSIELIDDDARQAARAVSRLSGAAANMVWRRAMKRGGLSVEPGVFALSRDGIPGRRMSCRKDYSGANKVGSRGIHAVYELPTGNFFYVYERNAKGCTSTYHIYSGRDGIRIASADEALAWASKTEGWQKNG